MSRFSFLVVLVWAMVLAAGLSGCLADLSDRTDGPCDQPATAGDGSFVQPDEPYWTRTTNRVPIPDGQERVEEIPGLTVEVDGEPVETVTSSAVVDGEPWMERWWSCNMGRLAVVPVTEGTEFHVSAGSDQSDTLHLSFTYRHPDGLDIGYPADPRWQEEGPTLTNRLPAMQEGRHDAFASVHYPDGSSRTHRFLVEFS